MDRWNRQRSPNDAHTHTSLSRCYTWGTRSSRNRYATNKPDKEKKKLIKSTFTFAVKIKSLKSLIIYLAKPFDGDEVWGSIFSSQTTKLVRNFNASWRGGGGRVKRGCQKPFVKAAKYLFVQLKKKRFSLTLFFVLIRRVNFNFTNFKLSEKKAEHNFFE